MNLVGRYQGHHQARVKMPSFGHMLLVSPPRGCGVPPWVAQVLHPGDCGVLPHDQVVGGLNGCGLLHEGLGQESGCDSGHLSRAAGGGDRGGCSVVGVLGGDQLQESSAGRGVLFFPEASTQRPIVSPVVG
jgi:hypothetical protein